MGDQATAASEGSKAVAASEDAEGPEEIQAQRKLQSPYLPTLSELQQHRITHLPFRAWCPECVEAFAGEMAHRRSSHERRDFPLISVDYFFLSSKGIVTRDEVENKWDSPPTDTLRVLAGRCSSTKTLFAHAVPQKGDDPNGYAAKCLPDSISWMGHARVAIRSNGCDVTCEGSTPYDPQSNGAAESAARLVKGQLRALQLGLERELSSHIPIGHPILTWMVRHAAMVSTMFVVGDDGKTAWQRTRGKVCNIDLIQFGEVTRYKCRSQEKGIADSGLRFGMGVWLGIDERTGQHIIYDSNHGIRHARTLLRLPDAQKFESERAAAVSVTPWSTSPVAKPGIVFD